MKFISILFIYFPSYFERHFYVIYASKLELNLKSDSKFIENLSTHSRVMRLTKHGQTRGNLIYVDHSKQRKKKDECG